MEVRQLVCWWCQGVHGRPYMYMWWWWGGPGLLGPLLLRLPTHLIWTPHLSPSPAHLTCLISPPHLDISPPCLTGSPRPHLPISPADLTYLPTVPTPHLHTPALITFSHPYTGTLCFGNTVGRLGKPPLIHAPVIPPTPSHTGL